jgi:hypothetical protein
VVLERIYYLTNPCIATLNALDWKICLKASQQIFCQLVGITIRQYIKQLNKEKKSRSYEKYTFMAKLQCMLNLGLYIETLNIE